MQQRPDLMGNLNLPRRSDPPMPMTQPGYPLVGMVPGTAGSRPHDEFRPYDTPKPEEGSPMMEMVRPNSEMMRPAPTPAPSGTPVLATRDCTRVIVYGRPGCPACIEAIQDLIDRQVCFTYHDVTKDEQAMMQLQAICGGQAVVPVVVQVGVKGV